MASGRLQTPRVEATRRLADRAAALPAWPLLGLICATSALTIVILGTRLTFFNDDWYFLFQRPGLSADSVFAPHNGHLSALPILVYKGLVQVFGLDSQLPFRLLLGAAVACVGFLVYALVSQRAGSLLGLLAATIILFLGPAWEDLLWSFQIGLIGSMATGLAVLLAMERDTPSRNAMACLLLVCSISLSNLGLPFVVGAGIAVALRRRISELWIPAIPALLFAVWWLIYGSDTPTGLSLPNIQQLPVYVLNSAASGVASISGLVPQGVEGSETLNWGRVLLGVGAVAVAARWIRGVRPAARILVPVGAALTFWGLSGAGYIVGREPWASRYQLVHATLVILIASELFQPIRLDTRQAAAVVVVTLVAFGRTSWRSSPVST